MFVRNTLFLICNVVELAGIVLDVEQAGLFKRLAIRGGIRGHGDASDYGRIMSHPRGVQKVLSVLQIFCIYK